MAKQDKYGAVAGRGKSDSSLFSFIDLSDHPEITPIKYSKAGDYAIDIIPYIIGTKKHPLVVGGKAKVGDEQFVLDVWIHQNVGPKKRTIVCPTEYGQACPVCEHTAAIAAQYGRESKEAKANSKLWRKHKAVYFVVDPEDPGVVRLFETSYKNFQDELQKKADREAKRTGLDFIPYGERDGVTVNFYVEMTKNEIITNPFPEFKDFEFTPRKKDTYSQKFFDSIPSLDKLMITYSTEEVQAIFEGAEIEEDEKEEEEETPPLKKTPVEEDEPVRARKPPVAEEPEEDVKKCPTKGGRFGVTIDELPECEGCKLASACGAEYRKNTRRGK